MYIAILTNAIDVSIVVNSIIKTILIVVSDIDRIKVFISRIDTINFLTSDKRNYKLNTNIVNGHLALCSLNHLVK